jgi:hypothetical protein
MSGVPILMASGWAPFPLPLHLVRWQYEALGFPTDVIPFRLSDNRDLRQYEAHVTEYVPWYCRRHGLRQVNLMGISLGAPASLGAIKRGGIAPLVASFASVGGPLLGSPLWVLAAPSGVFTPLGFQIRPFSGYLTALARLPLPEGPTYVAVSGSRDRTCPVWSATLPGAHNFVLDFGHGAVLGSPIIPPVIAPFLARNTPPP